MLQFIERVKVKKTNLYYFKDEYNNSIALTSNELKEKILNNEHIPGFKIDSAGRLAYSGEILDGSQFGDWKVLYRLDGQHVKCLCTLCNTEHDVTISKLKSGNSTCCKQCSTHKQKENLVGKKFNHWSVIKHVGKSKYECQCDCNNKTVRIIQASLLKNGITKSCGCASSAFKDISGEKFGNWVVIKYISDGYWLCECQCENKTRRKIYGGALRTGRTKSCGCIKENSRVKTLYDKYGDASTHHTDSPREQWQIETIQDKNKLLSIIEDGETITSLAYKLGISYSYAEKIVHKYELESNININEAQSEYEKELVEFIRELCKCEVQTKCRSVITPLELDIYIPEKKLAIEFNGNYWHSTIQKDRHYHQEKTIACAKQGIRLIHIFEHEWITNKDMLKSFLTDVVNTNKIRVFARNTDIREINSTDEKEFINKYHLQGYAKSSVCFGCYFEGELISVMSFNKPRFNSNYEYEIIRYCTKSGYAVVGGIERLFNKFLLKYKPNSIITYSDISKFTGNCYSKIGFKPIQPNPITEPNYVWVSADKTKILTRYQTQKHKLIEAGLGTEDETEDEIMMSLNYLKIYDSGNLRLEYINNIISYDL